MGETGVQERVSYELPRHEVGLHRPQGKAGDNILAGADFQQEAKYSGDDKGSNTGRYWAHR
jgi:hypothetical protein